MYYNRILKQVVKLTLIRFLICSIFSLPSKAKHEIGWEKEKSKRREEIIRTTKIWLVSKIFNQSQIVFSKLSCTCTSIMQINSYLFKASLPETRMVIHVLCETPSSVYLIHRVYQRKLRVHCVYQNVSGFLF